MNKHVIHIDGVPGSGKSYMCSKLKNITCIDTDDIETESFNTIEASQKTNHKIERTYENLENLSAALVRKITDQCKNVVFVGMTVEIPNADHKYFIKIDDLLSSYKRLQLRELHQIIQNQKQIKTSIKRITPEEQFHIARAADLSWKFPVGFDEYADNYSERLKKAETNGFIPKTQKEILYILKKL